MPMALDFPSDPDASIKSTSMTMAPDFMFDLDSDWVNLLDMPWTCVFGCSSAGSPRERQDKRGAKKKCFTLLMQVYLIIKIEKNNTSAIAGYRISFYCSYLLCIQSFPYLNLTMFSECSVKPKAQMCSMATILKHLANDAKSSSTYAIAGAFEFILPSIASASPGAAGSNSDSGSDENSGSASDEDTDGNSGSARDEDTDDSLGSARDEDIDDNSGSARDEDIDDGPGLGCVTYPSLYYTYHTYYGITKSTY